MFCGLLMSVISYPVLELYLTDATKKKKKQPLTRQLTISSYGSAAGRLVYLFLMKYGVFLYVFVMALLTLGNPFL